VIGGGNRKKAVIMKFSKMIKNLLSLIGLLLLMTAASFSQTVNINKAGTIAKNHLLTANISTLKSARLKRENIHFKLAKTEVENKDTLFYILNDSVNNVFVIVSADQRAWPVLGYSNQGTFDETKQPDAFKVMLEQRGKEIAYIKANNLQPDRKVTEQWNQLKSGSINTPSTGVEPLVKTTWDQGCYYNELCPADNNGACGHVTTGCVATAMAQIMKFWNYPNLGVGSATYNHPVYGDLSADFESAPYQWANMPNRLTESNNEVARLMYHCGVALRMDYSPGNSGSYCQTAVKSLASYFKYNGNYQTIKKHDVDNRFWISALKNEIDAGKPILISGFNNSIGHAFIIDGYRDEIYFHFNWGWSGDSDGFYYMQNLHAETMLFNEAQEAYLNICPNDLPQGMSGFYPTTSFLNMKADQDTKTFKVVSSVKWTAISDQLWLSVSHNSGPAGATELTVSVQGNSSLTTRKATLKVSTPEFGTKVITIYQPNKITVSAGSLQATLGNKLDTIRYLSLIGNIDARDFKTMRDKMPFLIEVDLKNASIVKYTGTEGTIGSAMESYNDNSIPEYAFNKEPGKCYSIQQITFPQNLKIIDKNAFYKCDDLQNVVIPAPVEVVNTNAFRHCFSLETVDLPSTVKSFEGIPFDSQYLLFNAINVDQANPNYTSIDGILFDKNKTNILLYPCQKLGKTYSIPNTVKTIIDGVFSNNKYLKTILIPPSVENIANFAFINCDAIPVADEKSPYFYSADSVLFNKAMTKTVFCSKLKRGKYIIPSTIKTVGSFSFANTRLDSIFIPNSVTRIDPGAFNSSAIKHVVIPSSVTSIGYNAFSFCLQLRSVAIPKSVKTIEAAAFASNNLCQLKSIFVDNHIPPDLGGQVFSNVDTYKCTLYVPFGAKTTYKNSPSEWSSFVNIVEMPNQAPVANAGKDQTVNENLIVTLDGTLSADPELQLLSYKWASPEGIILSSNVVAKPTFVAPEVTEDKIYKFTLEVSDGTSNSTIDEVSVLVKQVDKAPYVSNPIPNFAVKPGVKEQILDLKLFFADYDPNDVISYSIVYNSNEKIATTKLDGSNLIISYSSSEIGETEILINASSNGKQIQSRFKVILSFPTGNDQINVTENMVIYPNPTSGKFYVRFNYIPKDAIVLIVTDLTGKQIRNKVINKQEEWIDLKGQSPGVYLIKTNADSFNVQKVILK